MREPARETENSSNKHKLLDINEALDWFSPIDDLYASANVNIIPVCFQITRVS